MCQFNSFADKFGHHNNWKYCPGCGIAWEKDGDQFGCWSCGYVKNDIRDKILNWFAIGQVGASSKAMALAVIEMPHSSSHPCDPDDLNRCLLLLAAVPDIRNHMDKVASISTTWAKLVERWDEVEQCFLDEVGLDWTKGNRATRTFKLMKEIGC